MSAGQRRWLGVDRACDDRVEQTLLDALARAGAGDVLSGRSAAQVHGLDLIESELPVEVTVPRNRSLARPDLVVRRAELAVDDRTMVAGLPVTSVLRTIMDVARHATLDEAVVVPDSALRMPELSSTSSSALRIRRARGPAVASTACASWCRLTAPIRSRRAPAC